MNYSLIRLNNLVTLVPTCRFSLRRVKLNVFASDKKALRADFCSFFTIVIQSIADKTVLIAPVLI